MGRKGRLTTMVALGFLTAIPQGLGAESHAATAAHAPAAPAATAGPIQAAVVVNDFTLVDRAPVRNGFGLFSIEAVGLLPSPRKRESFTPTEDEHFYTLRRTVERFLQRKEIPIGWSRSNEAGFSFGNELAHLRSGDGIAYAVEGELVVRGNSPIPLGLSLKAPADGMPLRYSAGLMVADQVVAKTEGLLDEGNRRMTLMVAMRPNGPDAAVPVRAVFAVRAESGDAEAQRKSLAGITAALTASSDGRSAVAERSNDASEWLKPPQVFVKPGDVATGGHGEEKDKKDKKDKKAEKAEGGGHH